MAQVSLPKDLLPRDLGHQLLLTCLLCNNYFYALCEISLLVLIHISSAGTWASQHNSQWLNREYLTLSKDLELAAPCYEKGFLLHILSSPAGVLKQKTSSQKHRNSKLVETNISQINLSGLGWPLRWTTDALFHFSPLQRRQQVLGIV